MLDMHITKEGKRVLIAQMDDEHLTNFIALVLRQVLAAQAAKQDDLTDYHRALYDLPTVDDKAVAQLTREALQRLYPYLAEAFLRGLKAPRKLLIEVLGREEAVPDYSGFPQLPSAIDFEEFPSELGDFD